MPIINVTLPSDGTTADVADYNSVITAMLATINGLLDDDNIASLNGSKIVAGTIPITAFSADSRKGYITGVLAAPNTITYLGNRSYQMVFNGVDYTDRLSIADRIRGTRSIAAPTRCTSLDGNTQYWVKTSPNKSTFTDDFVVTANIKLLAYPESLSDNIISRYNGTSGWQFRVESDGRVALIGFNGGAANYSRVMSLAALPLNRWIRVTAKLDMSAFTATTTTSWIMFDDVDVAAAVDRGGTNPTALVQAGNLEVGSTNGGTLTINAKISQLAYFTASVTQATMRTYTSQTFAGNETSLGSAWSFDNSVVDLNTTTPNDLSVGAGGVVATNADSPYGQDATTVPSGSSEFGIVTNVAFSTNTTVTVQVPEGSMLPTSGGLSAVAFSHDKSPFVFPTDPNRWEVILRYKTRIQGVGGAAFAFINLGHRFNVPIGAWDVGYSSYAITTHGGANFLGWHTTLSTGTTTNADPDFGANSIVINVSLNEVDGYVSKFKLVTLTAAQEYYLNIAPGTTATALYLGDASQVNTPTIMRARFGLL